MKITRRKMRQMILEISDAAKELEKIAADKEKERLASEKAAAEQKAKDVAELEAKKAADEAARLKLIQYFNSGIKTWMAFYKENSDILSMTLLNPHGAMEEAERDFSQEKGKAKAHAKKRKERIKYDEKGMFGTLGDDEYDYLGNLAHGAEKSVRKALAVFFDKYARDEHDRLRKGYSEELKRKGDIKASEYMEKQKGTYEDDVGGYYGATKLVTKDETSVRVWGARQHFQVQPDHPLSNWANFLGNLGVDPAKLDPIKKQIENARKFQKYASNRDVPKSEVKDRMIGPLNRALDSALEDNQSSELKGLSKSLQAKIQDTSMKVYDNMFQVTKL